MSIGLVVTIILLYMITPLSSDGRSGQVVVGSESAVNNYR